jgi:hypothetical protein
MAEVTSIGQKISALLPLFVLKISHFMLQFFTALLKSY